LINFVLKGNKLKVLFDSKTKLCLNEKFSSLLGIHPNIGDIKYEKFSSGLNHCSVILLIMPAQNMKIDASNIDYTQRVK